jgi:hypothetical protein
MAELAARRAEAALDTEIKTQLAKSEQIKVSHAAYRKVCQQQKIQPVLEAALQETPPPSISFHFVKGLNEQWNRK